MYEVFYGLREAPFSITPDPRFLFYSRRHREAYDHLLFGIRRRVGFVQLTGEVGAGKTTLCRALLENLGDDVSTALILNPMMTEIQMLRTVLRELGLSAKGNDRMRLMDRLNQFLLSELSSGRDVVLIIDEAQDLSAKLLEQIRLLSNLETDQRKLLQIVLMGQPELRRMLDRHELRQLRQRITVRYHLAPLDRHETRLYLEHRLRVAGTDGTDAAPAFSPFAVAAIHRYAGGVPRLINAAADKTLLCGYVQERRRLGWLQVRRAVRDLEGKS